MPNGKRLREDSGKTAGMKPLEFPCSHSKEPRFGCPGTLVAEIGQTPM